jgi:hypothetical protein
LPVEALQVTGSHYTTPENRCIGSKVHGVSLCSIVRATSQRVNGLFAPKSATSAAIAMLTSALKASQSPNIQYNRGHFGCEAMAGGEQPGECAAERFSGRVAASQYN